MIKILLLEFSIGEGTGCRLVLKLECGKKFLLEGIKKLHCGFPGILSQNLGLR